MRRLPSMALLLLLALAACNGSSNPTEPPDPVPLPMGIAKATAFANLPLIRQLQNQKKPGTLLVGLNTSCMDLDGRVCTGGLWSYSFSDRSGPSDIRYNWGVWDTGLIESFDPVPANGPASGIDIGPALLVDSPQAVSIGLREIGEDYLQVFPDGFVWIFYQHFASTVRATVTFDTFSAFCQVRVVLSSTSGEVLGVDDCCLTGAC